MLNNICYIISAGEHYDETVIKRPGDILIAVDAGYKYCKDYGIVPDLVVGDFDSLGSVPDFENVIKLNTIKDETDTLEAVRVGMSRGFKNFHIYGGTGGRSAHTIANIQLLKMLAEHNCCGFLFGYKEVFTVINSSIKFSKNSLGFVSVFSLDTISKGVKETGLKYKLDGYDMKNSDIIGVSNEFIGNESEVSVQDGNLLIVFSDRANVETTYVK